MIGLIYTMGLSRRFWALNWAVTAHVWEGGITQMALDRLRQEAPYRDSEEEHHLHLRDSFEAETDLSFASATVQFSSRAPHARYVIRGTDPHEIRPRLARALHFLGEGGESVFAAHVWHPGTAPNPFHERAMRGLHDDVVDKFKLAVEAGLL